MTWFTRRSPSPAPEQLAEAVMALACPLCAAPAGLSCDPWSEAAGLTRPGCGLCGIPASCRTWCDAAGGLVVISAEPLKVLHTGRALAAAAAGLVSREAVLAQFATGQAPPSFAREEQEARS